MNGRFMIMEPSQSQHTLSGTLSVGGFMALLLLLPMPSHAANTSIPWECSNYEGEAQSRCLNTLIELQREKLDQLEGQLQLQQGAVGQLRDQVDRQAAATAKLQRELSDRPSTSVEPIPYPYPYAYVYPPAFGLGLYFGRPWIYGVPYFYRPYWGGPRYYRHWTHHR